MALSHTENVLQDAATEFFLEDKEEEGGKNGDDKKLNHGSFI
jgi:hypothetical protein